MKNILIETGKKLAVMFSAMLAIGSLSLAILLPFTLMFWPIIPLVIVGVFMGNVMIRLIELGY